jgi:hypothetical protein
VKLQKDLREFIESFNAHGVKYVIVGGHALAFHGHPRHTGDTDFFVESAEDNAQRIARALKQFGFGQVGLSAGDFLKADTVVQLGYPPNRIDIVTSIDGVEFGVAWAQRVSSALDGVPVHFLSRALLIQNKRASGRPQDLADLAALDEAI